MNQATRLIILILYVILFFFGLLFTVEGGLALGYFESLSILGIVWIIAGGLMVIGSIAGFFRFGSDYASWKWPALLLGVLVLVALLATSGLATANYVSCAKDRTAYARQVWDGLKQGPREQYQKLAKCTGFDACAESFTNAIYTTLLVNLIVSWILTLLVALPILLIFAFEQREGGSPQTGGGFGLGLVPGPKIYKYIEAGHLKRTGGHHWADGPWTAYYRLTGGQIPSNCPCLDKNKGGVHELDLQDTAGAHVFVRLDDGSAIFGITPTCDHCNHPHRYAALGLAIDQTRGFHVAVIYRVLSAGADLHAQFEALRKRNDDLPVDQNLVYVKPANRGQV